MKCFGISCVSPQAYFALSLTGNITLHIIQVTQLLVRRCQYLFPPTLCSAQLKTHHRTLTLARPSLDGPLFMCCRLLLPERVDFMTHSFYR